MIMLALKQVEQQQAVSDSRKLYEKVRFAPIHGVTPVPPQLESKPSSASLLIGLGQAAVGGFSTYQKLGGDFKTKDNNNGEDNNNNGEDG